MTDSKLSQFKLHYEQDKPYRAMHYELHQLRKKFKKGGRMKVTRASNQETKQSNKKETTTVKTKNNFFTHKITLTFAAIIAIAIVSASTLWVKQAFDNYNQNLINQGVQQEKDRVKALEAEVAKRSKTEQ